MKKSTTKQHTAKAALPRAKSGCDVVFHKVNNSISTDKKIKNEKAKVVKPNLLLVSFSG